MGHPQGLVDLERVGQPPKKPHPGKHPLGPPPRHPEHRLIGVAKGKNSQPRPHPLTDRRPQPDQERKGQPTLLSGRWRDPQVHSALP